MIDTIAGALPPSEAIALKGWIETFYPYQQDWLDDPSQFALINKSRQIGASHTLAAIAVLWGAFLGETTTIISLGEREAKEVVEKAARHVSVLAAVGSKMAQMTVAAKEELRFASGGRILALPNSAGERGAGRGYSGNVILDEVAYYQAPEKTFEAALGVVIHEGNKLRCASTPNGVGNKWHELWTKADELGYKRHLVTVDDAIGAGLPLDRDKLWAIAFGDQRIYDQMFMGSFIDAVNQLIPQHAIDACRVENLGAVPQVGDCYAGLDIGKEADRTELVVVRVGKDSGGQHRAYVIHAESLSRTNDGDIDRLAHKAFSDFRCKRLALDATGIGAFPAQRMQQRYGQMRIWPIWFTQGTKEELATTMHHAFVNGWVRIHRDDETMLRDVAAIRREVTRAGNIKYDAPRTKEGHADRAWALALALHATHLMGEKTEVPL